MTTRIILTVLDDQKRPYMGDFESGETFYPRLYENGGLQESEHDFLVELARHAQKTWLPADNKWPLGCIPRWIVEAVWVQLEAGPGCYYKFEFHPPLEIIQPLRAIDDPYR